VCSGKLTAFWANNNEKMEVLQFETTGHQQFIPRSILENLFIAEEVNQLNAQQSPRMNKNAKQKQNRAQQLPAEPSMPISRLPTASVTSFGLSPSLQSYLDVSYFPGQRSLL
jgi:hypothetical protein